MWRVARTNCRRRAWRTGRAPAVPHRARPRATTGGGSVTAVRHPNRGAPHPNVAPDLRNSRLLKACLPLGIPRDAPVTRHTDHLRHNTSPRSPPPGGNVAATPPHPTRCGDGPRKPQRLAELRPVLGSRRIDTSRVQPRPADNSTVSACGGFCDVAKAGPGHSLGLRAMWGGGVALRPAR